MSPRNRKQLEASLTGATCFIAVTAITFFALPAEYRYIVFAGTTSCTVTYLGSEDLLQIRL